MLHLVPTLAHAFLATLEATWRYRETGLENLRAAQETGRPVILAFLHGRTFTILRRLSRKDRGRWVSMCSQSLDGEAMARIEERLGLDVVRGSSGRGGLEAIQEMIRRVRSRPGWGAALAVDGSRGPRGKVQGGVVRLARWTGGVIVPVTAAAKPAHIFRRAWDRTLLPLPFSRVDLGYGEGIEMPERMNAQQAEAIRGELEQRFEQLQAVVDARNGSGDPELFS